MATIELRIILNSVKLDVYTMQRKYDKPPCAFQGIKDKRSGHSSSKRHTGTLEQNSDGSCVEDPDTAELPER